MPGRLEHGVGARPIAPTRDAAADEDTGLGVVGGEGVGRNVEPGDALLRSVEAALAVREGGAAVLVDAGPDEAPERTIVTVREGLPDPHPNVEAETFASRTRAGDREDGTALLVEAGALKST